MQPFVNRFDLKQRPFIGTTSMGSDWSLLMCRQGLVRPGTLVVDPFVGTGSVLVTASALGGICIGADRDPRAYNIPDKIVARQILESKQQQQQQQHHQNHQNQDDHGSKQKSATPSGSMESKDEEGGGESVESQNELKNSESSSLETSAMMKVTFAELDAQRKDKRPSIFINFEHYKIPSPCIVRMDSATPAWYDKSRWDCIVTDPPYGIRAGARKVGTTERAEKRGTVGTAEKHANHIPSTVIYSLEEVLCDLTNLAATQLKVGGRLVYWLPTIESQFSPARDIPNHPALTLIANSAQWLHGVPPKDVYRRLLTFEKTREPIQGESVSIGGKSELSMRQERMIAENKERELARKKLLQSSTL